METVVVLGITYGFLVMAYAVSKYFSKRYQKRGRWRQSGLMTIALHMANSHRGTGSWEPMIRNIRDETLPWWKKIFETTQD